MPVLLLNYLVKWLFFYAYTVTIAIYVQHNNLKHDIAKIYKWTKYTFIIDVYSTIIESFIFLLYIFLVFGQWPKQRLVRSDNGKFVFIDVRVFFVGRCHTDLIINIHNTTKLKINVLQLCYFMCRPPKIFLNDAKDLCLCMHFGFGFHTFVIHTQSYLLCSLKFNKHDHTHIHT